MNSQKPEYRTYRKRKWLKFVDANKLDRGQGLLCKKVDTAPIEEYNDNCNNEWAGKC